MSGWEWLSQGGVLFFVLFTMLLGLIFTLIPILPGTLIIWAAALVYGLALGWPKLGWLTFGLITFLMLVGMAADTLAGHFGARVGGASWLAIIVGAILGFVLGLLVSLIGSPILGCFAGVLGAVGGVLGIEWQRRKDWRLATRATQGYIAGAAAGIMAKVTSGVLMVAIFLIRVYGWP